MNSRDTHTPAMRAYQSSEEPERLFAVTGKYWRIMLAIEVVICCAAIAAGAYMLVMTFFNFSLNKAQTSAPQSLNRAQLAHIITGLQTRKELFQELQASPDSIADPSR